MSKLYNSLLLNMVNILCIKKRKKGKHWLSLTIGLTILSFLFYLHSFVLASLNFNAINIDFLVINISLN